MRHRHRTLGEHVARALTFAGLLYIAVLAYVVPVALLEQPTDLDLTIPDGPSALSRSLDHPGWGPSLAAQFPACADMASWTRSRVPRTVIVVDRERVVARIPFDEAYDRATSSSAADDVWIVGACP